MDKFYDIHSDVFSNPVEYHFVCLSETWMRPYSTENYEIKNYTCITRPRTQINRRAKRGSGGLILYIHEKIKNHVEISKVWTEYGSSYTMLYIIKVKLQSFVAFAIYHQ